MDSFLFHNDANAQTPLPQIFSKIRQFSAVKFDKSSFFRKNHQQQVAN
jgi:hypothetical protein